MKIKIRLPRPSAQDLAVQVRARSTVDHVKQCIEELEGIPQDDQVLKFNDEVF